MVLMIYDIVLDRELLADVEILKAGAFKSLQSLTTL